jgi:hypothetical protein
VKFLGWAQEILIPSVCSNQIAVEEEEDSVADQEVEVDVVVNLTTTIQDG